MKQPSNAVLLEKLENIEEHLVTLNGAVKDNTKFRYISLGVLKTIGYITGGGGVITFIFMILR